MKNYNEAIEAVKVLVSNEEKLEELEALIDKYEREINKK